jgi:hypothetical protein
MSCIFCFSCIKINDPLLLTSYLFTIICLMPLYQFISFTMQGAPTVDGRPGASMAPYDFEKSRERLTKMFPNYSVRDVDVLSHAMYPKACTCTCTARPESWLGTISANDNSCHVITFACTPPCIRQWRNAQFSSKQCSNALPSPRL